MAKYLLTFSIFLLVFLFSCKKVDVQEDVNNPTNPINSNNYGTIIINLNWRFPVLIIGCGAMSFVDVEIKGGITNFKQTYSSSPVRIEKRLLKGNYTYKITKRPVNGCSNFTPIIYNGILSVSPCPVACNNVTNLNLALD